MLRSHIASAAGGRIVLRGEVLGELAISRSALLYGALCPSENTAVLSPIPPAYWDRAYKIVVHTAHSPGSLAAAARAIADLGIGVILSWASNESARSHLSCTFIVVIDDALLARLGGSSGLCNCLRGSLGEKLSDLRMFRDEEGGLAPVRVTPLAFLSAYRRRLVNAEWHCGNVTGHSLRLAETRRLDGKRSDTSLWERLLNACGSRNVSACILSCDTEEALLRVAPIPGNARLHQLEFELRIVSKEGTFFGYWQRALDALAEAGYPVFLARNVLISKEVAPPCEHAEFRFTADLGESADVGRSLAELKAKWEERLASSFASLARERGDEVTLGEIRLTRPRGVGVPCFLATNAKRGEEGAPVAAEICMLLEGHGFKPVGVEIALGKTGLRTEVCDLVRACRFMLVLHCPEEKLRNRDGSYGISQWVAFEEGLMQAQGGHIMRILFPNIPSPVYSDRVGVQLSASELDDRTRRNISERLSRWEPEMQGGDGHELPNDVAVRDLFAYYGSK